MKKFFLFAAILITFCVCYLILFVYYRDADRSKEFPPCLNNGQKWIIGYMQSGKFKGYDSSFKNFINQLAELGWLEPVDWKKLTAGANARDMWYFLAKNMRSKYLQIETKYFWSADWNRDKRRALSRQVLSKLKNKKIDLMLAMGVWAGKDLANNSHSTPTLSLGSSFPIEKSFEKSGEIPGHIYLVRNPNFLIRQIRLFKKITKFKTLGVVYKASSEGRFLASLKLLKQYSKEENFKLIAIKTLPFRKVQSKEHLNNHVKAYEKLAPQIDAMWVTSGLINCPKMAKQILAPLFKYKIPTWYPHGEHGVANGVVFGVIHDPKKRARHYALTTAKIFNGVKPSSQIKDLPINNHLVINCAAAHKIGLKVSKSLLGVAKKSYLHINTGGNQ